MTGLMQGKRGLIMGLANDRVARLGHRQEARASRARRWRSAIRARRWRSACARSPPKLGQDFLIECDVADMAALDKTFATLATRWPTIDFVVHAIGFSDKNELRGGYVDTSLDNFLMTMNISVYSASSRWRSAPRR